jgi:MFS transporter, SP family, galactose:H+ symporter
MFLGFLQQVTGINTVIYYAPTIFQMAGFNNASNAIAATMGIGVVNVLSTIFAILVIDRIGRRPLLFAGLFGMGISLLFLSTSFSLADVQYLRYAAVIGLFVYVISFAFSLGALLWLMVSEIFPLEVRGSAMSLAVFCCWFWNFAVSSTFLTMVETFGASQTFLFYAAMCGLGMLVSYFIVPETKNVSLETIESNIRARLPLRRIGIAE